MRDPLKRTSYIKRKYDVDSDSEGTCSANGKDLIFTGEVGNKLCTFVWENLLKAGSNLDNDNKAKEGRRLFLNSKGGCPYSMMSIIDILEEVEDLATVATGSCMSAAVPIIAAGTKGKRYATSRTRFMIHPVWTENHRAMELVDMKVEASELQECSRNYAAVMAKYCGHSYQWWLKTIQVHKEWYFDAKTALSHGIIDKILGESPPESKRTRRSKGRT